MLDILALFLAFVILIFGLGPGLMPKALGCPLQRVTVGIVASLTVIYLLSFGIYVLGLPAAAHWLLFVVSLEVGWLCRHRLLLLWCDPAVRQSAVAWLAIATWLLGWQYTVYSYSGATWQGDWYEHYDRALFFVGHWDIHHKFLAIYSLAARPPLANLVTAAFLSLGGINFHIFQTICILLASLIVWPVCLLQRRMANPGEAVQPGWMILLLLALPALVQNATFTWTKLPTTFFILAGIALLSARKTTFGVRLAGWFSMSAGMLTHYSAGPWIMALAAARFVRHPKEWHHVLSRQSLAIALACGMLFATWVGWSAKNLGVRETFASNTTIADGTNLTWGMRVSHAAENLYYTAVPVLFRKVEYGGYLPEDPFVRFRDLYFNAVQSSALMIAGSLGVLVAGCLLWVERRQFDYSGVRFWGTLIGMGLVLGIVVHTEVVPLGVGQICLLPFSLMVVAWLAARVPGSLLRRVLMLGLTLDLTFGIVLHYALQSLWLPSWYYPGKSADEIIHLFGLGARENLLARQRIAEPFLHDLNGASLTSVLLLLCAVTLMIQSFRQRHPGAGNSNLCPPSVITSGNGSRQVSA